MSTTKKKKRNLTIITICYLVMLAGYSFIYLKKVDSILFLPALVILFAVIAWVSAYIDYRISKLRDELLNNSE